MATKKAQTGADVKVKASRSTYTEERAQAVLERVSNGEPLAAVCRNMGIGLTTWYGWEKAQEGLLERVARAREAGEEMIAVDALRIADTPVLGEETKADANGNTIEVKQADMLGHRKLQIETRLKLLACWNPRKWGSKVGVGGADDLPAIKTQPDADLDARLAALLAKTHGTDAS